MFRSLQELIEWKKLVDKVNQLMDAFKLDQQLSGANAEQGKGLARPNEHGEKFHPNRETENGFPQKSTSCGDGNQNSEDMEASLAGKRCRRRVRFQIDGDITDGRQDSMENRKVSGACAKSSAAVRSNIEREAISSKREHKREEGNSESETCASVLILHNDIGVGDSSSGHHRCGVNLQEKPKSAIRRDNKIFKSRSIRVKDQTENEEIAYADDPYVFLGSQSQKTKRSRGKQRQVDDLPLFEDPAKLPKRMKRSDRSGMAHPLYTSKKYLVNPCSSDKNELEEMEALSHQITEAEAYDLVLSQQLRCAELHKQDQSASSSSKDHCRVEQSSVDGENSTRETSNSCQVSSSNDNALVSDVQLTSFRSETSDHHRDEAKYRRMEGRKRKKVKSNKKSASNGKDTTGNTSMLSILLCHNF